MNLALEQGTGVSTYARNLSYALKGIGAEVSVLYGTRAAPSLNPLIREIAFFDGRVGKPPRWLSALRGIRRTVLAPFGELAERVPFSDRVIKTAFESRLPAADHIWNVADLFSFAPNLFKFFARRLQVRMPDTPHLMHWTYPVPLKVAGAKNIYTLHDLVPLRLPYTTLDHKRRYFRLSRLLAARADLIVTVSENSASDIHTLLGVPRERIVNTYQAVDIPRKFRDVPAPDAAAEIRGAFGLEWKRYWLFVGAIEPKKNIGRMIEAYLASGVEDPLVIVGREAWKSEEELKMIFDDHNRYLLMQGNQTFTKRKVMRLDYVPFRLLVSIMRGAKCLLFPSLYEGFGLPALEAMSLGTPVISSNTSSLPEVVGDAAMMVDPYAPREMVAAIRMLDADPELAARLTVEGPVQAAQFSAERYQARLAAMYRGLGATVDGPG